MLFVLRNLLHREDLRTPCQHRHFYVVVDAEIIGHLFKAVHIFLRKGSVIFEEYLRIGIILVGYKYIYFSPLDMIL